MRDGFIRKKVQKVVSKTGVQIRILPEQCYVMGLSNDGAADSQDDVVCSGHYGCVERVPLFLA